MGKMEMNEVSTVAAIIINWNGSCDTIELIESLLLCQNKSTQISVIVIDNASHTADFNALMGGISRLSDKVQISLHKNGVNVGVPAAYNQAIQIAGMDFDYYLRLDNDVVINRAGLRLLINSLETNQNVELVGGNVKYYNFPEKNNGGAVTIDLINGRTIVSYPNENTICDGVLGCIMLISGRLVKKYTPEVFDSSLFICTDESELSLRAKRDGMLTYYVSNTIGLHKSGVSTSKVSFLSNYYSARNWTLHRLEYVQGFWCNFILTINFIFDIARTAIKGRWAFPLGFFAGLLLSISRSIDRRVRFGR